MTSQNQFRSTLMHNLQLLHATSASKDTIAQLRQPLCLNFVQEATTVLKAQTTLPDVLPATSANQEQHQQPHAHKDSIA